MQESSQKGYLKVNSLLFADMVAQAIQDMVGITFTSSKESFREAVFKTPFKMVSYISFSGIIQGNYLCAMDDVVALKLIGAYEEGMTPEQIFELRSDYSGLIKEVLNLSVGQAIVELEKNFGDLTFSPSTVIYGDIEFPDVMSGSVDINGEHGTIQCGFSLNLANLKIGQKLEEALDDLERKTSEALEAQKNVQCILELLPTGLVAIDQNGIILPGYSKSVSNVVGLGKDAQITGACLTDILSVDECVVDGWKNWLNLVYTKYSEIPFKDMAELCELNEFQNNNMKILKLNWLPVSDVSGKQLEKMLVVIEDITKERELEKKMNDLNQHHQENLELISQVINLGADEVTNFIYDSSQLLTDAQKVVESESHDREFVNELFRTFHTLKGSSGQFRFKALQEMAHKVEDYLKTFRDASQRIDTSAIQEIKHSIEDAKGYISRIQDIKSKLGGKDETLKQKAERDPGSVMVNLGDVKTLIKSVKRVLEKSENQSYDQYFVQELRDLYGKIKELRKVSLSFFISSLESLIKNTCEKVGKKASLTITNDIAIDVEIIRKIHQCLIHLINNALDHGIETPEMRLKLGKIDSGVILLYGKKRDNFIEICVEDDGQGINYEAVRKKIINQYNVRSCDVENMTFEKLTQYLFHPGFSTKTEVSEISGRGVGMDFVYHTIKKIGGDVSVISESGKGTKVVISIPDEIQH